MPDENDDQRETTERLIEGALAVAARSAAKAETLPDYRSERENSAEWIGFAKKVPPRALTAAEAESLRGLSESVSVVEIEAAGGPEAWAKAAMASIGLIGRGTFSSPVPAFTVNERLFELLPESAKEALRAVRDNEILQGFSYGLAPRERTAALLAEGATHAVALFIESALAELPPALLEEVNAVRDQFSLVVGSETRLVPLPPDGRVS